MGSVCHPAPVRAKSALKYPEDSAKSLALGSRDSNRDEIMKRIRSTPVALGQALTVAGLAMSFSAVVVPGVAPAADGGWQIAQLTIKDVLGPVINNSGEIVWFLNSDGGIFSNVRGKLADGGLYPHLSNDGEVIYADYYSGGLKWDLVSTERGRLTFGGVINVNRSSFDVNSSGEVVYATEDASGHFQIFSTVRGQITFEATDHYNPCINDLGEIVWDQYLPGLGGRLVSSSRGLLPENYRVGALDLNNLGEVCFSSYLPSSEGDYSSPHIFSSTHGVVINDADRFQWNGGINDAGTIVWTAPEVPGSATWYVYQAQWIVPEPSALALSAMGGLLCCYCRSKFLVRDAG